LKGEKIMELEERKNIAQTIVNQLGGRRFMMMTGVKKFGMNSKGGIEFKIGRNATSCNHVSIDYNFGKDLYEVTFGRIRAGKYTVMKKLEEVYFDELQERFTEFTGLYTRLA
jgi:hypothetical protein